MYIAAYDAGGNLYQMISVVDNTGDAGSGILLADAAYETVADYPVGARITLTLDATSMSTTPMACIRSIR